MQETYAKLGSWNVICDISGFKVKASETVLRWDGLRVIKRFCEERQPQDFVRGVPDDPTVPWTRPETANQFLSAPVTPGDL